MAGYIKGHIYNWVLTYYDCDGESHEVEFEASAKYAHEILRNYQTVYPDAELSVGQPD